MNFKKTKYIVEIKMIRIKSKVLLLIILLIAVNISISQDNKISSLDAKKKESTVKKISKMLKENYVFPETAEKMADYLKSQLNSKAYDDINEPKKFAEILTADLQSISKDKHLGVNYNPDAAKRIKESEKNGPNPEQEKQELQFLKNENFGFKKVELLGGNIGYVDFRSFANAKYVKETVASVMKFLSNTDAIIFDVRMNGGGDPACVQLICSYVFGDKPVHLNDLYYRPADQTEEYWTLRKVDGKKMPDVPLYILTSSRTFSGAEEFAYNLKNLKRATIIGEATGGGAHPGSTLAVNNEFVIFLPTGRAINPITNTNWEGTGVTPDIPVTSFKALETAHVMALKKLADGTKEDADRKFYSWLSESIEAAMNAPVIDDKVLQSYAGIYGDRKIIYDGGKLYYQRGKRQKMEMTPMSENLFMFRDVDFFRLRIDKDAEGKVISVTGLYDTGDSDNSPKTN